MRARYTVLTLLAMIGPMSFGACEALAADKVKIGTVHMCCPICEKTIYGLLKKVKGLSDTKVSRTGNQVTFTSTGMEATNNAALALINDGYWGLMTVNSKTTPMPVEIPKIEGKWDQIVFKKVHLCCNACGTSIGNTVEIGNPRGLDPEENEFNRAKGTATFIGEGMDPNHLLELMHNAGFHGVFDAELSEKAE